MSKFRQKARRRVEQTLQASKGLHWQVQKIQLLDGTEDDAVGPTSTGWVMQWLPESEKWALTHAPSNRHVNIAHTDSFLMAQIVQYMALHAPCPEAEIVDMHHLGRTLNAAVQAVDGIASSGQLVQVVASMMNREEIGIATMTVKVEGGAS